MCGRYPDRVGRREVEEVDVGNVENDGHVVVDSAVVCEGVLESISVNSLGRSLRIKMKTVKYKFIKGKNLSENISAGIEFRKIDSW
jgi:hypothetical protein